MYSKNYLINHINEIKEERKLDLKKALSWGFYFTHHENITLKIANNILVPRDYDFVELVREEENLFHLHIEKVEVFDLDNLYNHCIYLDLIARELKIDKFNGFDVEDINFR